MSDVRTRHSDLQMHCTNVVICREDYHTGQVVHLAGWQYYFIIVWREARQGRSIGAYEMYPWFGVNSIINIEEGPKWSRVTTLYGHVTD